MSRKNQQGGIFFYILLAITLLAGLTYVISQNNRGNSNIITDEQAKIAAQEIIDYGNTVANAVQKLRLRGCKDTEISFENNVISAPLTFNYINGTKTDCFVFDVNGGNINYMPVPFSYIKEENLGNTYYGENVFSGNAAFYQIGDDCTNSSCNELFMITPYLKESICLQINNLVGISNPSNQPPDDDGDYGLETFRSGVLFKYEGSNNVQDIINGAITGKNEGCFNGNNDPGAAGNAYFKILIAR